VCAVHSDTIVAHCTPHGAGALAIIRISGEQACAIATRISRLPSDARITDVQTHTIHYGHIVDMHGNDVDQVLFFVMHAPRTFTGEDTVEISCHNNPSIIQSIVTLAIVAGARLAHAGEFTRWSVENGKMDLVQAESINDLINAGTQQSLKLSLAQLQGSLSCELALIEKKILKAYALSEASFEFIDEEDMQFGTQIALIMQEVMASIERLKKAHDMRQQIKEGARIALIGSVNAGKSSLFNALLGKDRAIVTAIAGTTRDVIEAGIYRNGSHMTLVDTAGLRATNDIIEHYGIERSYQEAQKADVILLVVDESRRMSAREKVIYEDLYRMYSSKIIVVGSKADLPALKSVDQALITCDIHVSTVTHTRVADLESLMMAKLTALCAIAEMPFLINKRQLTLILSFEVKIQECIVLLKGDVPYEILSYTIQEALSNFSELTGKTISESAMDAIFKEFCVGK